MDQLVHGVVAGIVAAIVMLLAGLLMKKPKTADPAAARSGEEWSSRAMFVRLILAGFLPLAGLILGVVGLISKPKRNQGAVLVSFSIGMFLVYALEQALFGTLFGLGLAVALFAYFNAAKYERRPMAISLGVSVALFLSYYAVTGSVYFTNTFCYPFGIHCPKQHGWLG